METFQKFAWKNRNFFDLDPRPPRFQTELTGSDRGFTVGLIYILYSFCSSYCLSGLHNNKQVLKTLFKSEVMHPALQKGLRENQVAQET